MISANLSRQSPPGLELRRPTGRTEQAPSLDHYTSSASGDEDEKSRLIFAGVGLAVALGAAAGAVWVTNNVDVPETPPVSLEAPATTTPRERVTPQPIVRPEAYPAVPRSSHSPGGPRFTPPGRTTTIDSQGNVTVPLGNSGVSIDTQGRTSVDLGPATLRSDGTTDVRLGDRFSIRSDGTTGLRLNENMTLRSDGTVEWHLGGGR